MRASAPRHHEERAFTSRMQGASCIGSPGPVYSGPDVGLVIMDYELGIRFTLAFDLANLGPYLSPGVTYYVSIRAVAIPGLKSGFSAAAAFSF